MERAHHVLVNESDYCRLIELCKTTRVSQADYFREIITNLVDSLDAKKVIDFIDLVHPNTSIVFRCDEAEYQRLMEHCSTTRIRISEYIRAGLCSLLDTYEEE